MSDAERLCPDVVEVLDDLLSGSERRRRQLELALDARFEEGRRAGLEEAARHLKGLAYYEAAAEVRALAAQPTPDDGDGAPI